MSARGSKMRWLALGGLLTVLGCAKREYLTTESLADIQRRDPSLELIRVYPSAKFVAVYDRDLGQNYDIDDQQGAVQTGLRGERLEIPVPRGAPGAILEFESDPKAPILWVTYDVRCNERTCAYGFVLTDDGLFRLFQVPTIAGYEPPRLFRKRVSRFRRMQKTKIYSRARSAPVYFTVRGLTASIALEILERTTVDLDTITVPQTGVPARMTPAKGAPINDPPTP